MPDPGLIFDSIFARETFKPHPNNVSSIFFTWASLIIHGTCLSSALISVQNLIGRQMFSRPAIQIKTSTRHHHTLTYPLFTGIIKTSRT